MQCDHDNNVLDFQMKMLKGLKKNEKIKDLGLEQNTDFMIILQTSNKKIFKKIIDFS